MLNHFERMQKRITDFVVKNSRVSSGRFTDLMMNTRELVTDVGTVLNGEQAVAEGLIDGVGTLSEVIEALYELIESNV